MGKLKVTVGDEELEIPWDSDKDPSQEELHHLVEAKLREVHPPNLWDKANTPLVPEVAEGQHNLAEDAMAGSRREAVYGTEHQSPLRAALLGAAEGAKEGAGNVISGFTSPLQIALTALTGAGGAVGRIGGSGRLAENALQGAQGAAGAAIEAGQGAKAGQAAAGLLGARRPLDIASKLIKGTQAVAGGGFVASGLKHASEAKDLGDVGLATTEVAGGLAGALSPFAKEPVRSVSTNREPVVNKPQQFSNEVPEDLINFDRRVTEDIGNTPDPARFNYDESQPYDQPLKQLGPGENPPPTGIDHFPKVEDPTAPVDPSVPEPELNDKTQVGKLVDYEALKAEMEARQRGELPPLTSDGEGENQIRNVPVPSKIQEETGITDASQPLDPHTVEEPPSNQPPSNQPPPQVPSTSPPSGPPTTPPYTPPPPSKPGSRPGIKFKEWVNSLRAAPVQQMVASRKVDPSLDAMGIQGILDYQADPSSHPSFRGIKSYFDNRHNELRNAGVDFGYKENYLPQMWQDPPHVVNQILGRSLGLRPGFTMKSILANYEEGISKGLTPKFTKMSDLVGFYEGKSQKLLAHRKFFNHLQDDDLIRSSINSPRGWQELHNFPITRFSETDPVSGVVTKHEHVKFMAPPEVARKINNYLVDDSHSPLAKFGKFNNWSKNLVISSGIPNTGLNAHGVSTGFRRALLGKGIKSTIQDLTHPDTAWARLSAKLDEAPKAMIEGGLTLGVEDHIFKGTSPNLRESMSAAGAQDLAKDVKAYLSSPDLKGVFRGTKRGFDILNAAHTKLFDEPLFQKVLPAWKLEHYLELKKTLLTEGMSPEDAAHTAGEQTNNIFGGMNLDEFARDKTLQNIFRATILAPDWTEGTIRMAHGTVKALMNQNSPEGHVYRQMMKGVVAAYVGANIANKVASGHWMFQNDTNHKFSVQLGEAGENTKDEKTKKTRYLKYMGTGGDYVRVPVETILSLIEDKNLAALTQLVRNRLSTSLTAAGPLVFNTDYRGRPMFSDSIPMNDQIDSAGAAVGNMFVPQYGGAAADYLKGNSSIEETLARAVEAPLTYSRPRKKKRGTTSNNGPLVPPPLK